MHAQSIRKDMVENLPDIPHLKGKNYDLFRLYSLTNGQLDILKEMIDVFLEQVKDYNFTITAAINEKNWDIIHKSTHKFKSSLKIIGIEHLIGHFETINFLAKERNNIEDIEKLVVIIKNTCSCCVDELHLFRNSI